MVIIGKKFGRLANRLWLFANFIAMSRRYHVTVANPAFAEYASLFRGTQHDPWCRYPAQPSATHVPDWRRSFNYQLSYLGSRTLSVLGMRRWPLQVVQLRGNAAIDMTGPEWQQRLRSSAPVVAHGWDFRDAAGVFEHASTIREFLRPLPACEAVVRDVTRRARADCQLLIGVHIRQTDYAQFSGGAFYFSAEAYAAAMRQIAQVLAPRTCAFLLCSDAPQRVEDFAGLQVTCARGSALEDLQALAACDYLMGPPSTYSAWASFYGEVPLLTLQNPTARLGPSDFSSRYYRHEGQADEVEARRRIPA